MNPIIRLPLLPLRDIVVFPAMTMTLLAGRPKSLKACEDALSGDGRILLVAQRKAVVEEPSQNDLYGIGVIAALVQHISLPESRMKLLVRGERRARNMDIIGNSAFAEPLDADSEPPPTIDLDILPADWTMADHNEPGNRVAELQRVLEDDTLSAAERANAASELIHGG